MDLGIFVAQLTELTKDYDHVALMSQVVLQEAHHQLHLHLYNAHVIALEIGLKL